MKNPPENAGNPDFRIFLGDVPATFASKNPSSVGGFRTHGRGRDEMMHILLFPTTSSDYSLLFPTIPVLLSLIHI